MPNQIGPHLEQRIVAFALGHPGYDQLHPHRTPQCVERVQLTILEESWRPPSPARSAENDRANPETQETP
jgi:hypothetical protein